MESTIPIVGQKIRELRLYDIPQAKGIFPYQVACQPGTSYEWPTDHTGEEKIVLQAGDRIHYQRDLPHARRNEGEEGCVVIWATSPPLSEDELQD